MLPSSTPTDLERSVLLAELRSRLVLEKRFNRHVFYSAFFALPLCFLLCLLFWFSGRLSNSLFYWWSAFYFVYLLVSIFAYRAWTRRLDSAYDLIVSSYPFPPTG